jgi:hypothetical protein
MGKKNKNGYGKGTWIDTKLFLSPAFISLGKPGSSPVTSYCSHAMLLMILGKRQFGQVRDRNGQKVKQRIDENQFYLTYKELAHRGIPQTAATRGIDELLAKGFLEIVEQGGAYDRHKTKFGLVGDWIDWKPRDPPIRTRPKDVKRGYQGKGIGAVKNQKLHTHAMDRDTHSRDGHPG